MKFLNCSIVFGHIIGNDTSLQLQPELLGTATATNENVVQPISLV